MPACLLLAASGRALTHSHVPAVALPRAGAAACRIRRLAREQPPLAPRCRLAARRSLPPGGARVPLPLDLGPPPPPPSCSAHVSVSTLRQADACTRLTRCAAGIPGSRPACMIAAAGRLASARRPLLCLRRRLASCPLASPIHASCIAASAGRPAASCRRSSAAPCLNTRSLRMGACVVAGGASRTPLHDLHTHASMCPWPASCSTTTCPSALCRLTAGCQWDDLASRLICTYAYHAPASRDGGLALERR